jgi:hypothetical protein
VGHWHVYQKWNAKLSKKCTPHIDSAVPILIQEIGSFDIYIIPRTHKLKECGVLGVSSDEYLNYATVNHREWEAKGVDITNSNMGAPSCTCGGMGDTVIGLDWIGLKVISVAGMPRVG